MNRFVSILIVLLTVLIQWGCISSPMLGGIVTFTKHTVHDKAAGPVISDASPVKRGESCSASTFLFSVAVVWFGGGGSIQDAAQSGGITKVAAVERSSFTILGPLFYRECVVVWGE